MSDFVSSLNGEQKEELKDVLAHPGMKHIVEWILWQKGAIPIAALNNTGCYEEVVEYKGIYQGFRDVARFLQDAQEKLRNHNSEDGE
jgi:hypothetical protein